MPTISSRLSVLAAIFLAVAISCTSSEKTINKTATGQEWILSGKITDSETQKGISEVSLKIEGSTYSVETDANGEFSMTLPKGFYELFMFKDGYEIESRQISLNQSRIVEFDIRKEISVATGNERDSLDSSYDLELPLSQRELFLISKIDSLENILSKMQARFYEADLSVEHNTFVDQYINEGTNCAVQNLSSINFSTSRDERQLRISEPIVLTVLNDELGYEVTIYLNEFRSRKRGDAFDISVDADYFFTEIPTQTTQSNDRINKKRKEFFKGTFRHFLISLASERSNLFFGYNFYGGNFTENVSGLGFASSRVEDLKVGKKYLTYSSGSRNYLSFDNEARIEYTRKGIERSKEKRMGSYYNQTSWISLSADEVEFSDNGTIKDKDALTKRGVWGYPTVCKMLPIDYLPN